MGDQFELSLQAPPASPEAPHETARERKRVTFRRKIDCTAPGATRDGRPAAAAERARGADAPKEPPRA